MHKVSGKKYQMYSKQAHANIAVNERMLYCISIATDNYLAPQINIEKVFQGNSLLALLFS